MEDYDSLDGYQNAQPKPQQEIIGKLRKIVKSQSPELVESVKWGNDCWLNGKLPVMFVHCKDDHVQFGFYGGSKLNDPDSLLQGKAEYVRHIPFYTAVDVVGKDLSGLIGQATVLDYKS